MLLTATQKKEAVDRAKRRLEGQLKPKGRILQAVQDIILIIDKVKNR